MDFKLENFEEMEEAMRYAIKEFGDAAEEVLKEEQKVFKQDMIRETWKATTKRTGNLIRGFRFDPITRNSSGDLETNFYAENRKNPHFHLVDSGHEIVTPATRKGKKLKNGGKRRGWVAGRRIKAPVLTKWETEHPQRLERMLGKICEEVNK